MTPKITVVVHPINTLAHPSIPPGYRWAVMVGEGALDDMDRCPNAGWCPTENEAWVEGEMVGVTAVKAMRYLGIPAEYAKLALAHDPIPPGGDRIHVGV